MSVCGRNVICVWLSVCVCVCVCVRLSEDIALVYNSSNLFILFNAESALIYAMKTYQQC